MSLQKLMNIDHCVFKIIEKKVSRADGHTDGRTDGRTDNVKILYTTTKKIGFLTQFECQNKILNVKIRFSDSVRVSK